MEEAIEDGVEGMEDEVGRIREENRRLRSENDELKVDKAKLNATLESLKRSIVDVAGSGSKGGRVKKTKTQILGKNKAAKEVRFANFIKWAGGILWELMKTMNAGFDRFDERENSVCQEGLSRVTLLDDEVESVLWTLTLADLLVNVFATTHRYAVKKLKGADEGKFVRRPTIP